MQQKEKLSFISYAKCFAILLVCIGHFLPRGELHKVLIYTFHVPVFFVIAGFLHKRGEGKQKVGKFLLGRVQRLIVPYVIFYTLSALWYVQRYPEAKPMEYWVKCFFFYEGRTLWNDAIWFIPTMLIVSTVFYFIVSRKTASTVRVAVLTAICFGATVYIQDKGIKLSLFGLDKAIHMCGYMGVGFLAKNVYDFAKKKRPYPSPRITVSLVSFLIFIMFCTIAHLVNGLDRISIMYCDYNDIRWYIPLAIVGSLSFMFMFYALPKLWAVETIANNTLFLMSIHYFVFMPWKETVLPLLGTELRWRLLGALVCLVVLLAFIFAYRFICNKFKLKYLPMAGEYIGLSSKG